MAKPSNGSGKARTPVQSLIYWGAVSAIWLVMAAIGFIIMFSLDLPDTSSLYETKRRPSITYLDRSNALIAVTGSQYAPPVDIDALPDYVPQAFIAIEDRRFFHHPGFDPIGITRSFLGNLTKKKGANLAGGSTITQQLARNLFLSADQTMKRKIQELMIAIWLEYKYTKKEILALYLNRVYYGAGAYGIEAASQRYFNKEAKDLTVAEAAMLAGLMKGPSAYSPLSDQERSGRRAMIVLGEMRKAKAITQEQYDEAVKTPITVSRTLATAHASYFIDWLDEEVHGLIDPNNTEDLIVETTLDLLIQTDAERAVRTILERDKGKKVEQAALVTIDGEGRVRAMIGGGSYAQSQFNRAVKAKRQSGSAFKPFVYLTAMEAGYQPATPVVDEPYTEGTWSPSNYNQKFEGNMDLQTALTRSTNTVAARVAREVGRDNVARTAHRLGIESKINTDPAMALGTADVSPLELAQSYAPFANGGFKVKAHGIVRIRTASGKVLYQHRAGNADGGRVRVINNPPLMHMNAMMRQVVSRGTGTGARIQGYDIAGKTGTTSDYRDAWFAGYTGGFVTVVWVGRDDNTPMTRITGGGTPAAIWKGFMTSALKRIQVSPIPDGPASSNLDAPAQGALDALLGTRAGEATASSAAAPTPTPDGLPPHVTMQPIPNPAERPAENNRSLDDIFSEAQRRSDE